MNTPRILLLTAWYFPYTHPRAHRWTAIAEHWAAQGFEVHVLCSRRRGFPALEQRNGVWVHRAGFDSLKEWIYYWLGDANGRGRVGAGARKPGLPARALAWLYTKVWKRIYFPDDAGIWYVPARKIMFQLLKSQSFDAVFSVSLPFTGHLLGLAAKRTFPDLTWVADIGDPFTIQLKPLNNTLFYGRRSRNLEKKVLENADASVVTNPGALQAYRNAFGASAVAKMTVIPPLLHPPRHDLAERSGTRTETLAATGMKIGYFGAFYAPVRTPDVLLRFLEKTFAEAPHWRGRLEVHLYGEIFPDFWDPLRREPAIHLHGLRPRTEVWEAIQTMDALLSIGNATGYQLPSKSVEYLATRKPVVHLSALEKDAFLEFWGDRPGLLPVRMWEKGMPDFRRWLTFLEQKPPSLPPPDIGPFLVETISAAYARLAGFGGNPPVTPGIAGAPPRR